MVLGIAIYIGVSYFELRVENLIKDAGLLLRPNGSSIGSSCVSEEIQLRAAIFSPS